MTIFNGKKNVSGSDWVLVTPVEACGSQTHTTVSNHGAFDAELIITESDNSVPAKPTPPTQGSSGIKFGNGKILQFTTASAIGEAIYARTSYSCQISYLVRELP